MSDIEKHKKSTSPKKILVSIGSVLILVLAAISFIFIPAMAQSGGTEIPPFGYYNKKPIEYKQGTYFTNLVQMYSEQVGSENLQNATFDIFNSAFTGAVFQLAFTQAVEATDYLPASNLVDRNMVPFFYDENGVYSSKLFNETPDSTKIELRDSIEESLVYQRYVDDFFGSATDKIGSYVMYGLKNPSAEEDFIQAMGEEQRTFQVVSFDMANYPAEEAVLWGTNNANLFTRHDLSVVSVADETEAANLLTQLQNNEILFEDAVTELSRNYYSGTDGKLTNAYEYQLNNIVTDESALSEITSLTEGALSGVIPTSNGYSIFRCDGSAVPANFEDETLVDAVISYMKSYESGIIETYYLDLAQNFWNTASVSGPEVACVEFGVTPTQVGPFPLNYGDSPLLTSMSSTDVALAGASTNENFMKTAFSMQMNEISSPMVLNNNVVLLMLTDETTVPAEGNIAFYADYVNQFDQAAIQNAIMTSDKLQNDFLNVFLKYFMSFE
ncbi:MAG: peptidylprolyl isomerase [Spirochaetaceae bacterium]|nr:peptidylprolyl isomerase [Spirochaetaceae bacterium]